MNKEKKNEIANQMFSFDLNFDLTRTAQLIDAISTADPSRSEANCARNSAVVRLSDHKCIHLLPVFMFDPKMGWQFQFLYGFLHSGISLECVRTDDRATIETWPALFVRVERGNRNTVQHGLLTRGCATRTPRAGPHIRFECIGNAVLFPKGLALETAKQPERQAKCEQRFHL